jgi:hypothetical protein
VEVPVRQHVVVLYHFQLPMLSTSRVPLKQTKWRVRGGVR